MMARYVRGWARLLRAAPTPRAAALLGVLLPGMLLSVRTGATAQGADPAAPATLRTLETPETDAGGVVTVVATAALSRDSVRYTITPAANVRLYAAPTGWARPSDDGVARIPITFGVPAGATAGPLGLGTLTFHDVEGGDVPLEARVRVRREAELTVDGELTATADGHAELGYRVRNLGNAPDTFTLHVTAPSGWTAPGPLSVAVGPGQEVEGRLTARVARAAARGSEHQVRVTLEGTDVRIARSGRVLVVGRESAIGGLAAIPASVFVGSATSADGSLPAIAVNAAGEVRPGTNVRLTAAHAETLSPALALRRPLSGPRLQLAVSDDQWSATLGDVSTVSELVPGFLTQGRGLMGDYSAGSVTAHVLAASPRTSPLSAEDGRVLQGGALYETGRGTFGLTATSILRSHDLLGTHASDGVAASWAFRSAGHDVQAEAGVVRVGDEERAVTGPAARIRHTLQHGDLFLATRLRKVPATTGRTGGQGDEAHVSGSLALSDAVTLSASGHTTSTPLLGAQRTASSTGASAGVQLRLPFDATGRVTGSWRSSTGFSAVTPTVTRSVRAGASLPVAGVVLEGHAELGSALQVAERVFRQARLGARWSGAGQHGWVGISHYDYGIGAPITGLDVSGSRSIGPAEIQAGLHARLNGSDRLRSTSAWAGVTARVNPQTRISGGVEFRGGSLSGPWRVSLGLSRDFGMPVPLRRSPAVQGVVFEDLDGNGVRDPDEPALSGMDVTLGPLRATTDENGRFRFYDDIAGTLRLDRTNLPFGTMSPARVAFTGGTAAIPVTRTGAMELRVFLDRNSNEALDGGEDFAGGALVSVRDAAAVSRDAMTDPAGRVRFDGLAPGQYTVTVHRPSGRGSPLQLDVTIRPGETLDRTVALPLRGMEIRMPDGRPLEFSRMGAADGREPTDSTRTALAAAETNGTDGGGATRSGRGEGVTSLESTTVRADRPEVRTEPPTISGNPLEALANQANQPEFRASQPEPSGGQQSHGPASGSKWWGLLVASLLALPGVVAARAGYTLRAAPA